MADPTQRVKSRGGKSDSPVVREPFEHLIQHIKQDDPMLYEALRKLTLDATNNAQNIKNVVNEIKPDGAVVIQDKATFGLVKALTVAQGLTLYYICRKAGTFLDCTAKIKDQAPTGSTAILDILRSTNDGVVWNTIFGASKLTLPAGSFATVTVKSFTVSNIAVGDLLRIDCTQIGSTLPGKGIEVVLRWTS